MGQSSDVSTEYQEAAEQVKDEVKDEVKPEVEQAKPKCGCCAQHCE